VTTKKGITVQRHIRRALLVIAVLSVFVIPVAVSAGDGFTDVEDTNVFKADIDWLAAADVTKGCNPPTNTLFCPKDTVTRETMAAFMHRLAINKVVDAATAVTADSATTAANADNADKLDGKDSAAFIEHGTIETTVGGVAWLPHDSAPTSIDRFVSGVRVSGDGDMVVGVNAPASFNGVEYGLESIELCVDVSSGGFVTLVEMYRTDTATETPQILSDATDRTTDGCYLYPVGKSVAKGAGIYMVLSGGGTVRIEGTTLTWTRDAFVQSAAGAGGSGANG